MNAPTLFDAVVRTPDDYKRADDQCGRILALLSRGPQTNVALAEISLKYTSRISDLRKRGHSIVCARLHGGLTTYTLNTEGADATKQTRALQEA